MKHQPYGSVQFSHHPSCVGKAACSLQQGDAKFFHLDQTFIVVTISVLSLTNGLTSSQLTVPLYLNVLRPLPQNPPNLAESILVYLSKYSPGHHFNLVDNHPVISLSTGLDTVQNRKTEFSCERSFLFETSLIYRCLNQTLSEIFSKGLVDCIACQAQIRIIIPYLEVEP